MVIKKIMCACAATIMLTVSASAACCQVELCHNTAVDIEATMWCVMHRADEWGQTVAEVITAPCQFFGYSSGNPVDEQFLPSHARCYLNTSGNIKRCCRKAFLWFSGDGRQNYFRDGNGNAWRLSE